MDRPRKGRSAQLNGSTMVFRHCLPMEIQEVRESIILRSCRLPNGCWEWLLSLDGCGYGVYRNSRAHIVAYLAWVGEVPDGFELDHLCRNRRCCNPVHLEVVTHLENMRRGATSKKTHCPRGHLYDIERTVHRSNGYTHQARACSRCDRETMARYREEHREEVRAYSREWSRQNKEKVAAYGRRQREKKRQERDESGTEG